ncbi:MAG: glycoside hydrolase family 3 C-terminal domain-containing protein [Armatimonadota bacterium]
MSEDITYINTDLPAHERARDLVSRMTLEEKVPQLMHDAPAIERLGVPAYNWWNECLHGVGRAGTATVFPQAIGMAATWDPELIHEVATAISDEARAKHHEALRQGEHGMYQGLTFWSPNINIFRDPRWGRGHETYGEDPYLTGRMGVAFVKGLQGDDPKYLKLVATPKHFAAHSGPEALRHEFNVNISKKDLYETYLPAFRECVIEGKAESVMGAYNSLYGDPCNANRLLLQDILRNEWGFDGYIVSDCGAIQDIHQSYKITNCTAESAAVSVKNGCDLECGCVYASLINAVEKGLITEKQIDIALIRLFTARFKLGMFDPPESVLYASIPYETVDSDENRELARETARQSIVLLKNNSRLLPLRKDLKTIAVIGPNADALDALLGNYNGTPSKWVTPLQGIRSAVSIGTRILYSKGCELVENDPACLPARKLFGEAVAAAQRSDVVIMCLGLTPLLEGEAGDAFNSDASGDRLRIELPEIQEVLLKTVTAVGKPVVLVLLNGGALAINWAQDNVDSIVEAWYPGEEGGSAIADILFGDYNPSGRLPVTFYKSLDDVPDFANYDMEGRTYRYFRGKPLYPFGFGLSYTHFKYTDLTISQSIKSGDDLIVYVKVTNTGDCMGNEVAQVYLSSLEEQRDVPIRKLVGIQRVTLSPSETKDIRFTLMPNLLSSVDNGGNLVQRPGKYKITVGGSQGDSRSIALGAGNVLECEFELSG